jgi:hypothetical protein
MRVKLVALLILLIAGRAQSVPSSEIIVAEGIDRVQLKLGIPYNPSKLTDNQLVGIFTQLMALGRPIRVAGGGFDITGEISSVQAVQHTAQIPSPSLRDVPRNNLAVDFKLSAVRNPDQYVMPRLPWITSLTILPAPFLPNPLSLSISVSPQLLSENKLLPKDVSFDPMSRRNR